MTLLTDTYAGPATETLYGMYFPIRSRTWLPMPALSIEFHAGETTDGIRHLGHITSLKPDETIDYKIGIGVDPEGNLILWLAWGDAAGTTESSNPRRNLAYSFRDRAGLLRQLEQMRYARAGEAADNPDRKQPLKAPNPLRTTFNGSPNRPRFDKVKLSA